MVGEINISGLKYISILFIWKKKQIKTMYREINQWSILWNALSTATHHILHKKLRLGQSMRHLDLFQDVHPSWHWGFVILFQSVTFWKSNDNGGYCWSYLFDELLIMAIYFHCNLYFCINFGSYWSHCTFGKCLILYLDGFTSKAIMG